MNIDLSQMDHNNQELSVESIVSIDKTYYEYTDIRNLSDVKVKGSIHLEGDARYILNLKLEGEMILPCAISLVDVKYPFAIEINEIIDPYDKKNDDYVKIIDNTLDIMPIIWQNIVVEIPTKVVSSDLRDAKLEGDGWKLLTEEEKMQELDPRLEKLSDLLREE